jgi:hypothetical protein
VEAGDLGNLPVAPDEELLRLKAMAEGSKPFEPSGLWDKLSALDLPEIKKLPARERLGVGYYTAAQLRVDALKGAES